MNSKRMKVNLLLISIVFTALLLQSCIVTKAVDVAAGTAIGVTNATVKTTGKVIGAAIPDSDKEQE